MGNPSLRAYLPPVVRLTFLVILGFLVIALGGFYFLLRGIYDDVERQYAQAAEEPMVDMAYLFASMVETDLEEGQIDPSRLKDAFDAAYRRDLRARIYNLNKDSLYTHVYVIDGEGIVIFDSNNGATEGEDFSEWNDVVLAMRGEYAARSSRTDPDESLSSVLHVAAPVRWEGEPVGVVSVARPESTMAMFVTETRDIILQQGMLAAGIVVIFGAVWTYWLLRPISHLTNYARAVRRRERTAKPHRVGFAELRTLRDALEEMRDELEGKQYVEQYVTTLTHELKSPLAAIRGAAELLDEDMPPEKRARFLENIRNETARSEDLVRRLLQLASLESRKGLNDAEEIRILELVQEEIDRVRPVLEPKSLSIILEEDAEGETISGDYFTLQTALHNLLSNAIDFSPENSVILVRYEVDDEEDELRLSVIDNGPGIPDYAIEKVFDRFYSLKHTVSGRKSSGLGLCFVKEAAELHGGRVEMTANEPSGVVATLVLPLDRE